MEDIKNELRGNIYNQAFRNLHKKKSIETTQTTTIDNLPNIKSNNSGEKANCIRRQVSSTKQQIIEMEAKLNKLRKIKEKYELQRKRNLTKIQFASNVKERVKKDQEYKQKIRKMNNQSVQQLKGQVFNLKDSLVRQKKNAQSSLVQMKKWAGEEERRKQKHHEYLITKLKQLEKLDNSKKVERVKAFHQLSASKMKQFHASRISLSKDNYKKKVLSALKERDSASQTLSRMRLEEQKLKKIVKDQQKLMLTSLYSLQVVNPQKRKRGGSFFNQSNQSDKNLKIDLDNYQNEEFQP